jgi:hypothetical protein
VTERTNAEDDPLNAGAFITRQTIVFLLLALIAASAAASEDVQVVPGDSLERASAVTVFSDGIYDWDYVKMEIPYVNYVRDRLSAELYVLMTLQETGAGGIEYTMTIVGQRQFAGMNDTLVWCSKPTDSSETARSDVVRTLEMGLMRYVARTPIGERIAIAYKGRSKPTDVKDRWDSWVFSLSCSPMIAGSQVDERRYVSGSFSADRVTPGLKMSYRVSGYYSESEQDLPSKTIHLIRRYGMFDGLAVKSIGDHWGVGLTGDALAQTYQNKKRYVDVSPAVEYSVFPYSQSTRRELALFAQVIYTDVAYQEMTIYDKTAEKLWSYRLSLPASIKEPWGSVYSSISFRQYLHDASIYRLSVSTSVSFQVAKGLWFDVTPSYARLHDLIDQPRRRLTDEEILLNLKSLASTYEYSVSVGFTYTFGSIYKNIVNPRFFGD